LTDSLNFSEK